MTANPGDRSIRGKLAAYERWARNGGGTEAARNARALRLSLRSAQTRRAAEDARRAVRESRNALNALLRIAANLDRIADEAESEITAIASGPDDGTASGR